MTFCIMFDKTTGQIVQTWQGGSETPIVPDPNDPNDNRLKLDFKEGFHCYGKRVNLSTLEFDADGKIQAGYIEDCPVFQRNNDRNAVLEQLQAIDDKTPRAMREHALTGSLASLQALEDKAQTLRDQLALLPIIAY